MSNVGGGSPPENDDPAANKSGGFSRYRHQNVGCNNKKNINRQNNETNNAFESPLVGYEIHVYNVNKNSGFDLFNNSTVKLSEYISKSVPNAGKFINAMKPNNLGFDAIPEPNDSVDGGTPVEYKKWKTR